MLNQRASQFRAIQRRLLTRFKDKTPSPLANLDTLLEGTYRQVCNTTAAKIPPQKNEIFTYLYFLCDKKKYSLKYLNIKKKEILNFIIVHDDNFLADLTFSRHNRGEQPVAGSGGSQSVQCYLPV